MSAKGVSVLKSTVNVDCIEVILTTQVSMDTVVMSMVNSCFRLKQGTYL